MKKCAKTCYWSNGFGECTKPDNVPCPLEVPTPVIKGEWIYHVDDLSPAESTQECSVCREHEKMSIVNDNYCPNCGAKMR